MSMIAFYFYTIPLAWLDTDRDAYLVTYDCRADWDAPASPSVSQLMIL